MVNPSQLSNSKYKQGYYKIQHPEKYIGQDYNKIVYRSSWEYYLCCYLDNNPKILKWSGEGMVIPYIKSSIDGNNGKSKVSRYFIDFVYHQSSGDDNIIDVVLVEVKPHAETLPPVRPKNETNKSLQNYSYALKMYSTNLCKWEATRSFCNKKGWKFVIITEQHLKKAGLMK